jgi:hypothetical protein
MINKNGKCINKFGICLNVLLHYGKYRKIVGEQVEIIKNNGLDKYNKLIGKIGFVKGFEYENFKKPIIIYFPKTKEQYCFAINEIKIFKGSDD